VRIFISYRTRDTREAAKALHTGLARRLHEPEIFIDVASLAPSADWRRAVVRSVRSADWCLVLIGADWLEWDQSGGLRIEDRSDVVRLEIATAITHGVAVLPVTVDGAHMPSTDRLPLNVARLTRFQRVEMSTVHLDDAVRRIAAVLEGGGEGSRRRPIPRELTGIWTHATAQGGSSYEFSADGTYVYSGILNQQRPTGPYTFEVFEEGVVNVEPSGVMYLEPLRASANQKDAGRPETDYTDSPRELIDKALRWRLLATTPPQLLIQAPAGSPTAYSFEWRDESDSG
jgi:hypothetical protein